eukprot:1156443-Pelagomonas_calceolata.AAC.7
MCIGLVREHEVLRHIVMEMVSCAGMRSGCLKLRFAKKSVLLDKHVQPCIHGFIPLHADQTLKQTNALQTPFPGTYPCLSDYFVEERRAIETALKHGKKFRERETHFLLNIAGLMHVGWQKEAAADMAELKALHCLHKKMMRVAWEKEAAADMAELKDFREKGRKLKTELEDTKQQ